MDEETRIDSYENLLESHSQNGDVRKFCEWGGLAGPASAEAQAEAENWERIIGCYDTFCIVFALAASSVVLWLWT